MLKRLRIELDRFGNMRRSSGKPLAHSLNSDPKKDNSSSIEDAASPLSRGRRHCLRPQRLRFRDRYSMADTYGLNRYFRNVDFGNLEQARVLGNISSQVKAFPLEDLPRAHRITDRSWSCHFGPANQHPKPASHHRRLSMSMDQTDIDGWREICARRIRDFASRRTRLKFILAHTAAPRCLSASIRLAWTRTSGRLNALTAMPF